MMMSFWERTGTCGPRTPVGRGTRPACPPYTGRAVSMKPPLRRVAVMVGAFFALAFTALAADPAITVSARQRYPWNGLVDLQFTITGTSGMKYDTSFTAADVVGGTNITMATVRKSNGVAANVAKEQLTPGTYNWVWDAAADLPKDFKCNEMTITGTANASPFPYSVKFNANGGTGTMANESFTYGTAKALTANAFTRAGYTFQGWATSANGAKAYSDKQSVSNLATSSGEVVNLYAVWKAALYMVIDLSSGALSYLDSAPSGGWTDNPYKQTKMAFRRIEKGTFSQTIGPNSKRNVTITKPFYISVHPLTFYHGFTLGCYAPADNVENLNVYGGWEKNTTTVLFSDGSPRLLNRLTTQKKGGNYYADCLALTINGKTKLSFTIPTEAQLTLARSSMNIGSTYTFSRDWFFSDLGNGAVTNPCQGSTYNGESAERMSCVNQTARAYTEVGGGYNPNVDGFTGKSVCVRLCLVVD